MHEEASDELTRDAPLPVPTADDMAAVEGAQGPDEDADPRVTRGRRRRTPGADEPLMHSDDEAAWFATLAATAGPDAPARARRVPRPDPAAGEALAARIVSRLNPEQARAVTTTEGPLLILAGAGSGKTRVLAHRVAYLVGVRGVRPSQVLAVTFTNKAANEMRARILGLVGEGGRDVAMGTFHSLCARVLRRDGSAIGIDPRFAIYDTDDQTSTMKLVMRAL